MRLDIKKRIELVNSGVIPEGYKRTDIGIVPDIWEIMSIKQIIKLVLRPVIMQDNEQYQLLTVRRAYGGIVSRGLFYGKDVLVKTQFRVNRGDFVISKRQIVHGACGLVDDDISKSIVSNEYNVFVATPGTCIEFFNYYMQRPKAQHLFYIVSIGVHIEKMLFSTKEWLKPKNCFS